MSGEGGAVGRTASTFTFRPNCSVKVLYTANAMQPKPNVTALSLKAVTILITLLMKHQINVKFHQPENNN